MGIEPKTIVKKLRGEGTERGSITLHMNVALFKRFQATLKKKGISASSYFEQIMEQTLSDLGEKKKASKKAAD